MRLILALVLGVGLTVTTAHAAYAGVPTCDGRRATLVGSPGATINGTSGPDVVVTNGAAQVVTHGGDDLVCITGVLPHQADGFDSVRVAAGPGDDTVDAHGYRRATTIYPGAGRDHVTGGSGPDQVDLRVASNDGSHVDLGGGNDLLVLVGHNGTAARTLRDTVLDGGAGDNTIFLANFAKQTSNVWDVDDTTRKISLDHLPVVSGWTRFTDFNVGSLVGSTFAFEGSSAAETFIATGLTAHRDDARDPVITATMGGGADHVRIPSEASTTVDGGPGHDTLDEFGSGAGAIPDLQLDLARGTATATVGQRDFDSTVTGIEDVQAASFTTAELRGDGVANRLSVSDTCHADLVGGGDDDVLVGGVVPHACKAPRGVVARGDAGDDVMDGSNAGDDLRGGSGTDSADGEGGIDHCVAETEVSCED